MTGQLHRVYDSKWNDFIITCSPWRSVLPNNPLLQENSTLNGQLLFSRLQDFGDTIPGHGGFMDRFDCQLLMATFVNVYYSSFIR